MSKIDSHKTGIVVCLAAFISLGGCGAQEETKDADNTATTVPTAEAPSDPQAAVAQCRTCHTFGEGEPHRVGPNLWGVHGKAAASQPGYQYSSALAGSGLVWNDETLHAYLENPRKTVPGGKMSFAGLRDETKRQAIIDYMKSTASAPEHSAPSD